MQKFITGILNFFEKQAFGVCSWWGEKLHIRSSRIRLFFIYLSFLTVGSPILLYLAMAFLLDLRNRVIISRSIIRDL